MSVTTLHGQSPQRVVFFLHMPKCAGTTVRGIFFKECCAVANNSKKRTWLSVNMYSAVPSKIEARIRKHLLDDEPRIFSEHHFHLDWGLAERLRQMVFTLRPSTQFRAFTIWLGFAQLGV